MPPLPKHNATVSVWLAYRCQCGHEGRLDWSDLSHDSSDCELCGSHGSITVDFPCGGCGKFYDVILREW